MGRSERDCHIESCIKFFPNTAVSLNILVTDATQISRLIAKGTLFRREKIATCNIAYGNEGRVLNKSTIRKVREDLQLTEEHGIDSALFYGDVPFIVDEFINKYRKTLHRLSKL
jgi:hypothetical protein